MGMKPDTEILIVGGGLNGPALALALASGGISSAIIDPTPKPTRKAANFDGRAYALSLTSINMLKALGVWQTVADNAQPMLDIVVSDGKAGEGASPLFLHFDHREIEEGPMGHMVEDRYLRRALLDAIDHPSITQVEAAVTAQRIIPGGIEVTLSDGKTLSGHLLVGCDGRQSGVAKRAGINQVAKDYGQTALVCAVEHERPHNDTAHQFFMPAGPLAILPLPGDQSSIVWTETHDRAAAIHTMSDTDYLTELRPRFGDFLGDIKLAGKRFTYPLGLIIADDFAADRVALAGDAAHGIHPLAGQGLNLGLRDVATLAETLISAARIGEDIGNPIVLARYARWRRTDTASLVGATDTINRVFSNDNSLLRLGRDLSLATINAVPAARRKLIREAAGLNGDLPLLLQGRQI